MHLLAFRFVYFTAVEAYRAGIFSASFTSVFTVHCLAQRRGLINICSINGWVMCQEEENGEDHKGMEKQILPPLLP